MKRIWALLLIVVVTLVCFILVLRDYKHHLDDIAQEIVNYRRTRMMAVKESRYTEPKARPPTQLK